MYHVARIKQWLGYLRKAYHQADGLFSEVRTLRVSADIADAIDRHATRIIA
jgi:tRNA-dihydrouridine synthase C